MKKEKQARFLKHVTWYLYNVASGKIIDAVYGDTVESYRNEKLQALVNSPLSWYADLDTEHQERFVQLVIDKYGE